MPHKYNPNDPSFQDIPLILPIPEVPAGPPNSPTSSLSPQHPSPLSQRLAAESLDNPSSGVFEHRDFFRMLATDNTEDDQGHESFRQEMERDARPLVRLPSPRNYFPRRDASGNEVIAGARPVRETREDSTLEDGEITEIDGLDGCDLSDVELDELLALEDPQDEELYKQLDEAVPRDFDELYRQLDHLESGAPRNFTDYMPPMYRLAPPGHLPPHPPPGLDPYPLLQVNHVWLTDAEIALAEDPYHLPYRARQPSRLRTCSTLKDISESRSSDESAEFWSDLIKDIEGWQDDRVGLVTNYGMRSSGFLRGHLKSKWVVARCSDGYDGGIAKERIWLFIIVTSIVHQDM